MKRATEQRDALATEGRALKARIDSAVEGEHKGSSGGLGGLSSWIAGVTKRKG